MELHGDVLQGDNLVDAASSVITVTIAEAVDAALEQCHYLPADKITRLRHRLIAIRFILAQVAKTLHEDDEPLLSSAEDKLNEIFDNQNK